MGKLNREIKFRVWNVNSQEFIPAGEVRIYSGGLIEGDDGKEWVETTSDVNIFQQYTGLKDKNGKEIYEGDILSRLLHKDESNWASEMVHKKECFHVVGFQDGCFISDRGITLYRAIKDIVNHHSFTQFEIVGNIYENPELLKH